MEEGGILTIFAPMVKSMDIYMENGKKVLVVKDLSFLHDRRNYSWIGREARHFRLKRALVTADMVIASNDQAARDLHKYYRVDAEAIIPENQDGPQDQAKV